MASSSSSNAEAGPSCPPVFLQPQGPPPNPVFLTSTQDLLARFNLITAYDKYVRPYATPVSHLSATAATAAALPTTDNSAATSTSPSQAPIPPGQDKGKGKERDLSTAPQTPGPPPSAHDDDDGKADIGPDGVKKKKNNYRHLIKGVPGKHSMKKDEYLVTMMVVPPKQRTQITPFDQRTQREAFTVSPEGLKGWSPNTLIAESPQAREDRKKRKELKRLAKLQAAGLPFHTTSTASPSPATPTFPPPQSATSTTAPHPLPLPRTGNGTPKPPPNLSVSVSMPSGITPIRSATGTPLSARAPPLSAGVGGLQSSASFPPSRGVKREREDGGLANGNVNGAGGGVNGVGLGAKQAAGTPAVLGGVKAGVVVPGVKPRPVKKQRMDTQGHARDVTAVQQQPTPQGV